MTVVTLRETNADKTLSIEDIRSDDSDDTGDVLPQWASVIDVTVSPVEETIFTMNQKNTPPPNAISMGHFISDDIGDSDDAILQWVYHIVPCW